MQFIWGLAGIIAGIALIWKTYPLVSIFGNINWAERHLGGGGTYTFYKLLGLLIILLSTMQMFGIIDLLFSPFRGIFGGFPTE